MRIQHNITAMSAYRNYTTNVSAVGKNLEKLSSGYKINRAGDDAAGLAISEKMRAQISGLEQAQNNAKSGINLVQTAEGALTEVHDMLNRMYTLAEQSANGTYDDSVDRVQLQKEVDQLRTEINRIADSANFNGINLLDGSLDSGTGTAQAVSVSAVADGIQTSGEAAKGVYSFHLKDLEIPAASNTPAEETPDPAADPNMTIEVGNVTLNNNPSQAVKAEYTITFEGTDALGGTGKFAAIAADDNVTYKTLGDIEVDGAGGTVADYFIVTAADGSELDLTSTTDKIATGTATLTFTAKTPGALPDTIKNTMTEAVDKGSIAETTPGANVGGGTPATKYSADLEFDLSKLSGGQIIEIGGKKLAIVTDGTDPTTGASPTADAKLDFNKYDVTEATDLTTLASDLKDQLDTLGLDFNITMEAGYAGGDETVKFTFEAKSDGHNDLTPTVIDNGTNAPDVVTISNIQDYVPAETGSSGVVGSVQYTGVDLTKMVDGSTLMVNGQEIKFINEDNADYAGKTFNDHVAVDSGTVYVDVTTAADLTADVLERALNASGAGGTDVVFKVDTDANGTTITAKGTNPGVDIDDTFKTTYKPAFTPAADDDSGDDDDAPANAITLKVSDGTNEAEITLEALSDTNGIITGQEIASKIKVDSDPDDAEVDGLITLGDMTYKVTVDVTNAKVTLTAQSVPTTAEQAKQKLTVQLSAGNDSNHSYDLAVHVDTPAVMAGGEKVAQGNFTLTSDMVKDGAQLTIGENTYTFKVGKKGLGGSTGTQIDLSAFEEKDGAELLRQAAIALSQQNNSMFDITSDNNTAKVYLTEKKGKVDYKTDWDLRGTDDAAIDGNWDEPVAETDGGTRKNGVVSYTASNGKGLTLQIGDTADSFNQLKVSISDCHADAMGIGSIDISSQSGASSAMKKIKDAINYVSDVRGTLGATQNRLDHTINNLGVMQENIQDAESTIRDVDVAEEMMAYTKNNILVQSAQAMLAQANQLPQGVLQLLG